MIRLIILIVSLNVIGAINSDEIPTVRTTNGLLRGKYMTSENGRIFQAFLGVPFAAPPTGPLRFMPPQPQAKWDGIRDAIEEGKMCVQLKPGGDEDCLYLNVFTTEESKNRSLPVMVYIHGGGFYGGSASIDSYGPEKFMDEDIVLVTIQYRLGVFGFLSIEDNVMPGNQGLKDQRLALQWVQENIKTFGGDPTKVTIFGNSAGSASVHLHMISLGSKDLFSRAISQSGTAFSAFAFSGKGTSRNITLLLAHTLQCPTNSSAEILHCLQNKSVDSIQREYSKLQHSSYKMRKALFRPIVEVGSSHAFLTENPLTTFSNKPWMVGIVQNEGLWKIHMPSLNETIQFIKSEHKKFLQSILFFEDTTSQPNEIADKIYDFYFKNSTTENDFVISLEHVITDSYFFWPTFQALERHEGLTYCYLFDHVGQHSITELFQAPKGFGVSHMDELLYLFPRKLFFPREMNQEDTNISNLLIKLWVNFAKEGNPTPTAISQSPQTVKDKQITWEPSVSGELKFLKIQTNALSMVKNVFPQRMNFWKQLPIWDKMQ
ncbi:juvenile hormone esterase-like [Macrosteles quadrilineatus]|uniref:juvenile hormone esterase-like n=1 Tax=Macrosteles quadrilineatus TaxID=74068 RepID=UPI0023E19B94|nr:juvenile hormone esterase-like [Macrosteles quadrilineatus]